MGPRAETFVIASYWSAWWVSDEWGTKEQASRVTQAPPESAPSLCRTATVVGGHVEALYSQVEAPDTLNFPSGQRKTPGPDFCPGYGPGQYIPEGHSAGHALSGVNQGLGKQYCRPSVVRSLPENVSGGASVLPPFAADQVGVVLPAGHEFGQDLKSLSMPT